jgi:hypothetical protein
VPDGVELPLIRARARRLGRRAVVMVHVMLDAEDRHEEAT